MAALGGVDALCLFVAEDDRPLPSTAGYVDWRLCGALSRVLKAGFFTGAKDDWLLLPSDGKLAVPRIFVVGLGARKRLDAGALYNIDALWTAIVARLPEARQGQLVRLLRLAGKGGGIAEVARQAVKGGRLLSRLVIDGIAGR